MGTYKVWVAGADVFGIIEGYDEEHDISGAFPGLTYDYFFDIGEPGPAYAFNGYPDEDFPFAIIHAGGQIVREPHPGSMPFPSVKAGIDAMREFLEASPNKIITPMKWHS